MHELYWKVFSHASLHLQCSANANHLEEKIKDLSSGIKTKMKTFKKTYAFFLRYFHMVDNVFENADKWSGSDS